MLKRNTRQPEGVRSPVLNTQIIEFYSGPDLLPW